MTPTLRPDDLTQRFDTSDDRDPGASDGIPIADDDLDRALTPLPSNIVAVGPEPTRKLPDLTLGQIFAVLWEVQRVAQRVGIDLEVDPMPAHEPTGVHLWSINHSALCAWLERERGRGFSSIEISRVLPDELLDAGLFLLTSLAQGLPLARVIEVGPARFAHWTWRDS